MSENEATLILGVMQQGFPGKLWVQVCHLKGQPDRWVIMSEQGIACEYAWQYLENKLLGMHMLLQAMAQVMGIRFGAPSAKEQLITAAGIPAGAGALVRP